MTASDLRKWQKKIDREKVFGVADIDDYDQLADRAIEYAEKLEDKLHKAVETLHVYAHKPNWYRAHDGRGNMNVFGYDTNGPYEALSTLRIIGSLEEKTDDSE